MPTEPETAVLEVPQNRALLFMQDSPWIARAVFTFSHSFHIIEARNELKGCNMKNEYGREIPRPHPVPDEFALAMAYVPWQKFEKLYDDLDKAYQYGTIFPELNKPFTGRRCVS